MADLESQIRELWERRDGLGPNDLDAARTVRAAIDLLGPDGEPIVHEWLKLAILLLFRVSAMETIEVGPFEFADRLPLKKGYEAAGVRVLPGASARWGSFMEPGVILMPSYVNIGARIGSGSMVDTWATVASCAQIGRNTHLSGGVGIGGVLEPPQAAPVMVGDDCMIGSRCMITEGARVGDGVVLGAGAILTGTIPVIDAETGAELSRGIVPSWCVAVSATRSKTYPGGEFGLPCVLIVRRLEPGERHDKAKLNDILRQHGGTV
jgi:2,3,4,5-tetrahydropyridine-2-carboxylate N-succinyltransferase